MTIKSILAATSGGPASEGAIELACRLAKRYEAHVEGFHVRIDPCELLASAAGAEFGGGMVMASEWMAQAENEAKNLAAKIKASFQEATSRHGIPVTSAPAKVATADWHEEVGYGPVLVSKRARFFDLTVLGRSDRVVRRPHTDTIEETLLHSGRPVLLAPVEPPATLAEKVIIGWNASVGAVHAVAASLPLLATAKEVLVVTIGEVEEGAVTSVIEYLARQGITAAHRAVEMAPGTSPGQQLLDYAADVEADLLVTGGYGQTPLHEFIFGGSTRDIVGHSTLPVLLYH